MKSKDAPARWYVIRTKRRQEERALENLTREGYECFHPVLRIERIRLRQRVLATESLFPRYLFIRLDEVHSNWYPLRSTLGVSGLVCFDDQALAVRDEVVELLRARLTGED